MFRALQLLIDDLYKINNEVFPPVSPAGEQGSVGGLALGPVLNFSGVAYPDNLRLDWDDLEGAFRYQIRIGNNWETARHVLTTATDMANVDPVWLHLIYGTYTFLIRGLNSSGQPGEISSAVLAIAQIPQPDLFVEVVLSTVLLRWTEPISSWRIHHYVIYKDNLEIGTISGTFKLIQEQIGGTYSYSVEAVDIVGNVSTRSAVKTVTLHDPSEYEFIDKINSYFAGGVSDNIEYQYDPVTDITNLLASVYEYTWEQHFTSFGFDSPEGQINADYPIYYQPTNLAPAVYEEGFDFGEKRKNIKVVVDYNKQQIAGYTDILCEITYLLRNDPVLGLIWADYTVGTSRLIDEEFQYIRIRLTCTNDTDKSLVSISNLSVSLNVTLTIDSGTADCLATDAGGTLITYTKIYTGISSVTAIPSQSLQPLYCICDAVNKTNFRCLIFDSSGNRASGTINWKSRGVV